MIRLLMCNSYVQVCGQRYKQEKGIPAVFMVKLLSLLL
jgi:hypothetical protein